MSKLFKKKILISRKILKYLKESGGLGESMSKTP